MNKLQEIAQKCPGVVIRERRGGASFTFPSSVVMIATMKDGVVEWEVLSEPVTIASASRAAKTPRQRKLMTLVQLSPDMIGPTVTFWTMPDLLWALNLPESFKNQVGMDLKHLRFSHRRIEYLYDERLNESVNWPVVYSTDLIPHSMSASFIRKKRREEAPNRLALLQRFRASAQSQ
jgi:hypothetical protein